ncbi:MAG: protein TolR [Acetobacteraceae bacterium]
MAAQLQGRSGSRRGYRPMADINITPMVDVMLVLLIIFMVTAPLLTSGVTVDLPKANATPLNQDATPITLSINATGQIFLADTQIPLNELVPKLRAIAHNNPNRRIFVRGDRSLPYGRIVQVMALITDGGFTKVALLAEATEPVTPARTKPAGTKG